MRTENKLLPTPSIPIDDLTIGTFAIVGNGPNKGNSIVRLETKLIGVFDPTLREDGILFIYLTENVFNTMTVRPYQQGESLTINF